MRSYNSHAVFLAVALSCGVAWADNGYLPAPCDGLAFPPPAAYRCPAPYVELIPDGTDDLFARNFECRETGKRLGVVADGTGGCGSSAGISGWTMPDVVVVAGGDLTEVQYREAMIALFKDYMLMQQDGVFWNDLSFELWMDGYKDAPNTIRGEHKPGGWFGRPPGSDWLKRLDALMDTWPPGLCLEIPLLPTHAANGWPGEICLQEISMLWSSSGNRNLFQLDGLAARFWLATICHERPQACNPYLPGPGTGYLLPISIRAGDSTGAEQ